MIIDDLWDSHGPSRADLEVLERLNRHREAFQPLRPQGEHRITVRNRLLGLLNDMEETVCEEGHAAPSLAQGWQLVDELEALYWEDPAETPAASEPAANDRTATRRAANDFIATRRAA